MPEASESIPHAEDFGEIVRAHQARVRLVCLAYLGDKDEADDAAQETFLKAYQALPRFRGKSSIKTWILRIADNHCRDLLRSRSRRPTDSLDGLRKKLGDALEGMLARRNKADEPPPYTPDDLTLLARLFSALTEEEREIIALFEIEELTYLEIAARLGVTVDAVKGRLKRARHKCQVLMPL